jgi:hypothetical protein
MRNKLIIGILIVFVVGSIAGITAYTSLSQEDKADAVDKPPKPDLKPLTVTMKEKKPYLLHIYVKDDEGDPVEGIRISGENTFGYPNGNTNIHISFDYTNENGLAAIYLPGYGDAAYLNGTFISDCYVPEGYLGFKGNYNCIGEDGGRLDEIELNIENFKMPDR